MGAAAQESGGSPRRRAQRPRIPDQLSDGKTGPERLGAHSVVRGGLGQGPVPLPLMDGLHFPFGMECAAVPGPWAPQGLVGLIVHHSVPDSCLLSGRSVLGTMPASEAAWW